MKTHFLKFALAALCMSAAQAPSADSGQEIAMAKCSRDDASNGCPSNDNTSSNEAAEQPNTASKVAPPRKSAAQKVVESEMEAHKAQ